MDVAQEESSSLIGQQLTSPNVLCPAAIIDRAVVKRNCEKMLRTVETLGLGWRVHVKTHKTAEVTRLQVGSDTTRPVRLVVSTVKEAEHLVPFMKDVLDREKRDVDVLYGVPPSTSCFERLQRVAKSCGEGFSLGFFIDHPTQLANFPLSGQNASSYMGTVGFWMKVDTGYHRAGNLPASRQFSDVCEAIANLEEEVSQKTGQQHELLRGFYSHLGTSYSSDSPDDALTFLAQEIERGVEAIEMAVKLQPRFAGRRLTLSVGATPQVASTQNLLVNKEQLTDAGTKALKVIADTQQRYELEVHAGVYPFLDLQQLATHARPKGGSKQDQTGGISEKDIGIRIMAEVLSVYDERVVADSSGKVEALIGAGSLALGREPCKSYPGWGILVPSAWTASLESTSRGRLQQGDDRHATQDEERGMIYYEEHGKTGWIVNRISQEHGVLSWEGTQQKLRPLRVGSKVMVWPNHACIAAAGYDWLLVVDESVNGGCEVVDVWQRCRGW